MPNFDRYDQKVPYPVLGDAPNIETSMRDLVNTSMSRTALRFPSATQRTAVLTGDSAPVLGMLTWLDNVKRYEYWDGAAWRRVVPQEQSGTVNVSFTNLDDRVIPVAFPQVFSAAPRVFANINSAAGVTGRWDVRAYDVTASGFTIFLYAHQPGALATWSNVPVFWFATSV
ncbi:H-type lectin domain-containing protein [Streptomyces albipurpureus]|uniref:H-type lectin domain-containing protein n=1 Tax=Streptomyces albipurpureus TaxID=2897419 RepID=A0ABT0USZ0_9ACTN|nr:H-type lectin domain-containing protein [Streptomyces sp. CWNU-1]MCM2391717.1 H-type lectin domain-containing protein [Streptomyces sp. CWNU-1]